MNTYSGLSIEASTAGIIIPYSSEDPAKFLYMVRNQGFYRYDNGDKGAVLTGSSTTAPKRNSSLGGELFVLDGHEILVHPSGKNYSGGFSLKDITAGNAELGTIAELGTAASAYGSNPSVGSFFKAEKVDESTYNLYFYTMGHGYGLYRVTTKSSNVENIEKGKNEINVYPNPVLDDLNVKSAEPIKKVEIYAISGTKVYALNVDDSAFVTINVSSLAPGVYFVRVNNKVHKVIKK